MISILLAATTVTTIPAFTTRLMTHWTARAESTCTCRAVAGPDTFFSHWALPWGRIRFSVDDINLPYLPHLSGKPTILVQTTWGPPGEWRPAERDPQSNSFYADFGTRVIVSGATGCYRVFMGQWEWREP